MKVVRPTRSFDGNGDGWQAIRAPSQDAPPFRLPESPFGRFAFAHGVVSAGDALVTLALANSLFFTLDPGAARTKLLLYLLVTLAPFTLLSPFIGPLIDRYAAWRRWFVIGSAFARAVMALLMAQHLKSVWLFPEAFTILVLSKAYSVARSSLVPTVVPHEDELVRANSRLSIVAGITGTLFLLPGGIIAKLWSGGGVLVFAAFVFVGAGAAATRIRTPFDGRSTLAPRPGRVAAHVSQRQVRSVFRHAHKRDVSIRQAAAAMAVLRGIVGFLTFLVLFEFRRNGLALVWFGAAATASAVGLQIGAVLAPGLRRALNEERIIVGTLFVTTATGVICALFRGPGASTAAAGLVAMSAQLGRLAFDSLVQRDGDESLRGSSFAKFETRFQLSWVLGALIPVVLTIPRVVGMLLLSAAAGGAIVVYVIGEPALERINDVQRAAKRRWRRPITLDDNDDTDRGR